MRFCGGFRKLGGSEERPEAHGVARELSLPAEGDAYVDTKILLRARKGAST